MRASLSLSRLYLVSDQTGEYACGAMGPAPLSSVYLYALCDCSTGSGLSALNHSLWKDIVEMKLRNQERLLLFLGRTPPPSFRQYLLSVEPGDATNQEAMAAKVYFRSLFGSDFRRHAQDALNAKLNYGYTILCSSFSRLVALHGYHPDLGIHHCSRDNPVNLPCDLMEPFRPLVDHLALQSGEGDLDWPLKKQLIALTSGRCWLEGRASTVEDAMEAFTLAVLSAAKSGKGKIPEVRFV